MRKVILYGALVLGLRSHHHERLMSYVWVLGVFIIYYLSAIGMSAIALKEWLPPWCAMWVPKVVYATIGGTLLYRTVRQ